MTNVFIGISEKDGFIEGLSKFGIVQLLLELDGEGWPVRELGLDQNNKVVHKCPNSEKQTFSIFSDGPIIGESGPISSSSYSATDFEELWKSSC